MPTETEKRALDHKQVCVFTRDGSLLWRSKKWSSHGARDDHTVLGHAWWEFCYELDGPRGILAWLASDDMRIFTCHFILPGSGRFARVRYSKAAQIRGAWLCYGAVELIPRIPKNITNAPPPTRKDA